MLRWWLEVDQVREGSNLVQLIKYDVTAIGTLVVVAVVAVLAVVVVVRSSSSSSSSSISSSSSPN
jgi:hypothetical protein